MILSTLFDKPSLSLAGFHHLLVSVNLSFIFNIKYYESLGFLEFISRKFEELETQKPGYSMPCFSNFRKINYLVLIISHYQMRNPHDKENVLRLVSLFTKTQEDAFITFEALKTIIPKLLNPSESIISGC